MDKETIKEIEDAIRLKARAKLLEEEAKGLNAHAKEILLPLMAAYELKDYTVCGVGKVIVKVSRGNSIGKVKLLENMILEGSSAESANKTIEKSSSSWETEYVEFKREKVK